MEKVVQKRRLADEGIPPLIEDPVEALMVFEEILRRELHFTLTLMKLQKDIREFVELLLSQRVEFLLVGGYALAFHGAPRFTEDIDFLVMVSAENASKLSHAVEEFGFGGLGLTTESFLERDQVIQLGRAPNRIDILTGASGITWEEAWASRSKEVVDGLEIPVIGKSMLEANKLATGRPQDLADVARLRQSAGDE